MCLLHGPSQSQDTDSIETDEWRRKMCTRCTMEYYPVIEKSKIPSLVAKHTGLEDTV